MAGRKTRPSAEQREHAEDEIAAASKQIRFNISEYTIEVLANKVRDNEFYVPEYQRNLTWKPDQKSRFIESVLVGLPIPFVFFWQDDDGRLEIVDGSQRLRTIREFIDGELILANLELLPALNGFAFGDLERSRQRKINNRSIRGIILDNDTSPATRTEMFNRINTGGTKANEAEIRRGVLPGPVTELIVELSKSADFVKLTPLPKQRIDSREREELIARFFAYTETAEVRDDEIIIPDYRDRPREFIYSFVERANRAAKDDPGYIVRLNRNFHRMTAFVERVFPNGFLKASGSSQVPRARFEAIAVGSALAIQDKSELIKGDVKVARWIDGAAFNEVTTSGGANVKAKLTGRIGYVRQKLVESVR